MDMISFISVKGSYLCASLYYFTTLLFLIININYYTTTAVAAAAGIVDRHDNTVCPQLVVFTSTHNTTAAATTTAAALWQAPLQATVQYRYRMICTHMSSSWYGSHFYLTMSIIHLLIDLFSSCMYYHGSYLAIYIIVLDQ